MHRPLTAAALAVLALAACNPGEPKKTGPAVAKGEGITITSEEFKARLDEQSPFIRARFTTLEKKKEFLDNLVRFEVLAREAKKQGLDQDPDVQTMMKRVMVQKLVQKSFAEDPEAAKKIPDADLAAYYEQHKDEYHRPAKVRVAHVLVKKEADAKKLLARIRAEEKKAPGAFASIAREASEDGATKGTGGDLGFRSKEELAAALSPAAAEAAFAMKDGETSELVATPQGFHVLKRTGWQDPVDRALDQVKPQIAAKLARERRSKEFDEYVKKLRDQANVKVDDAELDKVAVAPGPGSGAAGGMGMGGMMGGPPGRGSATGGGLSAPAPAAPTAPQPAAPKAQ